MTLAHAKILDAEAHIRGSKVNFRRTTCPRRKYVENSAWIDIIVAPISGSTTLYFTESKDKRSLAP